MSVTARLLAYVARTDGTPDLAAHLARLGELRSGPSLVDELAAADLRGRGGAGFPVAAKVAAVVAQRGRPHVVANGAEGEPASVKDKVLLRRAPHLVLDGVAAAAAAIGAREATVAVAAGARAERVRLLEAIDQRARAGLDAVRIGVAVVPDAFVAGEETALLRAIAGGPAKPTLKPPYPFERGVGGAPTLVQNVETLAQIALVARFGATWFRTAGTRETPGTALVTLSGAMTRAGVHEVELGTTLAALIEAAGGVAEPVSAFLVGGYFGEWVAAADVGATYLTPQRLGAGAIVALPSRACGIAECARVARYLAGESAGQCGPCAVGLPAVAEALERLARGDGGPRGELPQILTRWLGDLPGRGACRHPDGAARLVASGLAVFERELASHVRHGRCHGQPLGVLPLPARRAA